jgi:hypothetical protein
MEKAARGPPWNGRSVRELFVLPVVFVASVVLLIVADELVVRMLVLNHSIEWRDAVRWIVFAFGGVLLAICMVIFRHESPLNFFISLYRANEPSSGLLFLSWEAHRLTCLCGAGLCTKQIEL